MAKRQPVPVCSRCEAPFRTQTAFCSECGGPTPWATHDERVAWEVRQWRASRAREPERSSQVMLVKTDQGFLPAPAQQTQYVWDQPLHPEREQGQERQRARHEYLTNGHSGNGHAGNGHGANGHAPVAGSAAPAETAHPITQPVTQQQAHVPADPPAEEVSQPIVESRVSPPTPAQPPVIAPAETVTISKKAVAVAIALVLGLPLGSRALNIADSEPEAARAPAVAAAPAPLAAVRSGFTQISEDAVRYAVVIRNPNRALTARSVSISVALLDARGRVVGSDVESIPALHAGAAAVAGTTDAAGPVARLAVRIRSDGFVQGPARPFTVGSVALSRRRSAVVVGATVSGRRATTGARVVAVHFDAKGTIVGGDVAIVDIAAAPRTTKAVISTSDAGAVRRVEVYVISPR